MISIKEATQILGINDSTLYNKNNRYHTYVVRPTNGTRGDNRFRISDFKKDEAKRDYKRQQIKLFIEYIVYEKGVSRQTIADKLGVHQSRISTHNLTLEHLEQILLHYRRYVDEFDRFYK